MEGVARARLVDEHLPLLRAIAAKVKRQVASSIELDDLVAFGAEGLLDAADRFDPKFGVTFATYAYHRTRGAIYDGLRRMGHLPRGEYARARQAQRAHEVLENLAEREHGARASGAPGPSPPTQEDDARALAEALASVVTSFVTSLEGLQAQGRELADDATDAEERLGLAQTTARVRAALAQLPEKERHFIEKHYFQDKTLQDAGAELGLSKSWSSRLHARALELLRARLAD